ncbi:hypothetical protein D3C86_1446850 [compost metagenome]
MRSLSGIGTVSSVNGFNITGIDASCIGTAYNVIHIRTVHFDISTSYITASSAITIRQVVYSNRSAHRTFHVSAAWSYNIISAAVVVIVVDNGSIVIDIIDITTVIITIIASCVVNITHRNECPPVHRRIEAE